MREKVKDVSSWQRPGGDQVLGTEELGPRRFQFHPA
jgi:hypothetical protein